MAKDFALDIWQLLKNIDKKNYDYYDSLTQDQKKAYAPFVAMRWHTGTQDRRQVLLNNELVNKYVFNIGNHPGLLYRLQCVASQGQPQRYSWLSGSKANKKQKGLEIICQHQDISMKEAKESYHLFSAEDIVEMAEDLGFEKVEISKLKKELKKDSK